MFDREEVYVSTPSGDVTLVEVFREKKRVMIIFGETRIDLDLDSAFDLANAILLMANDLESGIG